MIGLVGHEEVLLIAVDWWAWAFIEFGVWGSLPV
jgi:hypothetical protein